MNVNTIDGSIVLIANALETGMTEEVLVDVLVDVMSKLNYDSGEIFLIMSAAKLLYKDRAEAPKSKGSFKRVSK